MGDGSAKWTLAIESDRFVQVMSLLESASAGIVTNLSTVPLRAADVVLRIPETAGSEEPVGAPVTLGASVDGATHSLEGPDADAFAIDSASGQIRTKPGVVYDHATQSTYWLIVVVTGENGETTRIGTRVDVTDVLELPGAPNPPTATSVTSSSIRLLWAAPDSPGSPIRDYDYRYRPADDGHEWAEIVDSAIGNAETIVTGLTAEAEYDVQVRAVNADGPGPWSDSARIRVWPPAPDAEVSGPWGMIHVNMLLDRPPRDFTSYCATLDMHTEIYGDQPIFINLFLNALNKMEIYGGLQTRIEGQLAAGDGQTEFVIADRGAIFSRWLERAEGAIRVAPGGLFLSNAGEADFISVRNELAWTQGSYRLCLKKSDMVEGERLPTRYTAEDVSHAWGRYEHTWVRMEVTDLATRETVWIGSLAFPGRTLTANAFNVLFVEVYGDDRIQVRQVPYFELSVRDVQIDGRNLRFTEVTEIANPGGAHRNAPVIAKAIYNRDERELVIRIGAFTGEFGKVERKLSR